MIRILAKMISGNITDNLPLDRLKTEKVEWAWVDFSEPDDSEIESFQQYFRFMHNTNKDTHRYARRPQLKFYNDHYFLSVQAISPDTLKAHELQLFMDDHNFVSFHMSNLKAINDVWHECRLDKTLSEEKSPMEVMHRLLVRLVDQYFMAANMLEDKIDSLDRNSKRESIHKLNNRVFQIRSELLGFRRMVTPLQDIIQRIIGTKVIPTSENDNIYFRNIYENLDRLTHMIESDLDITSDIRDSYLSITTYRTNSIMQTLTVITTIFMPLSFIAGVYGMNFKYMPELNWRAGYFVVLGLMAVVAFCMYVWFRKKGWFEK
ncbi:magnesium/cobalt transporter CorA [Sporolactobacillus sp. THM7-4]|nr:magnesium/cobalt transporter CorA [Sporolactobacillus sp. THM7-4]